MAPAYRLANAHGVEQFLSTTEGSLLNRPVDLIGLHRDGHEFPVEATVWSVEVGGIRSFNAFVRDVSVRLLAEDARKKEATLVQLLHSVTVAANRSSNIQHTAQTCLRLICSYTGWQVGHLFLQDAQFIGRIGFGGHLVRREGEEQRFAAFHEITGRPDSSTTGLPGYIVASGRPEWIGNLADGDPSDRTRARVSAAGLQSAFGFPILVAGEIDRDSGVLLPV